jgi:hypothetical protein
MESYRHKQAMALVKFTNIYYSLKLHLIPKVNPICHPRIYCLDSSQINLQPILQTITRIDSQIFPQSNPQINL